MSLPILVIMVIAGVSAVGLAVHLSGGSRDAALTGEAMARARYAEDFPDDSVEEVVMAADGAGAVLKIGNGVVGIVHNFGDRFVTRRLAPGTPVETREDGSDGFVLLPHEFAWTEARFRFGDADACRRARSAVDALHGRLGRTG